jgi:hypothetical protein
LRQLTPGGCADSITVQTEHGEGSRANAPATSSDEVSPPQ